MMEGFVGNHLLFFEGDFTDEVGVSVHLPLFALTLSDFCDFASIFYFALHPLVRPRWRPADAPSVSSTNFKSGQLRG